MNSISALLCTFAICETAAAQPPREKPGELGVVGSYAGEWTTDVISNPAAPCC